MHDRGMKSVELHTGLSEEWDLLIPFLLRTGVNWQRKRGR